jgi:hypothetical protein
MFDALGVYIDSGDDSASLVITGPLPESVEQNVEFVRQRRVRDEWRSRVKRGEITRTVSETPPPGLSAWLEWRGPLMAGAAVWLGLVTGAGLGSQADAAAMASQHSCSMLMDAAATATARM